MPFLSPNQQWQRTEGIIIITTAVQTGLALVSSVESMTLTAGGLLIKVLNTHAAMQTRVSHTPTLCTHQTA